VAHSFKAFVISDQEFSSPDVPIAAIASAVQSHADNRSFYLIVCHAANYVSVVVLDRDNSLGAGGIVAQELKAALFGAPVAHEDHAQRACYAALEMRRAIKEYGERVKRDCGFDFKMRVGLNSGPVIVGGVGNDLRMEYTALVQASNLRSCIAEKRFTFHIIKRSGEFSVNIPVELLAHNILMFAQDYAMRRWFLRKKVSPSSVH
jgi:hypothetical protein